MTATESFSRRIFLRRSLILASAGLLPVGKVLAAEAGEILAGHLYSARSPTSGQFTCTGFDLSGEKLFETLAQQRMHQPLLHPSRRAVLFVARRPGTVCYWLNARDGRVLSELTARAQRHFYGHGIFDARGERLYLSENDLSQPGRGVIGVYRLEGEQFVFEQELDAHGVEPHQLAWLPGQKALVIANGGLITEAGSRDVLNPDDVQSSLVVVDTRGNLLSQDTLSDPYDSIRHLAVCSDGTVIAGQQHQSNSPDSCLLAIKAPGQSLTAFPLTEMQHASLNQYVASVAVHARMNSLVIASPRGNRVMMWDLATRRTLLDLPFPDVAGVAAVTEGFLVSSGQRGLMLLQQRGSVVNTRPLDFPPVGWDNHLVV